MIIAKKIKFSFMTHTKKQSCGIIKQKVQKIKGWHDKKAGNKKNKSI
jgi:hypothetical protein